MSATDLARLTEQLGAYEDDPVGFAVDVLNIEPDLWQCRFLEAVRDRNRIAVRSSTGQGKDFTFAIAVLWFLASFWKAYCPCTANTRDQLERVLWKQFRDLHFGSNGLDVVFEWAATTIKHRHYGAEWLAFATTSAKKISHGERNAEGSQGHHAENMLVGIDEASGVDEEFWGAYEFTLSQPNNKLVVIGNPNRLSGSFYQIWNKPIVGGFWSKFTVAGRESKRIISSAIVGDQVFVSGRGNQSGNHDYLISKYGPAHPWVQSKVYGVHPTSANPFSAYAFDQVMAARRKYRTVMGPDGEPEQVRRIIPNDTDPVQIGVDIALRRDRIAYVTRRGLPPSLGGRGARFSLKIERKQSVHHIVDVIKELAEAEPDPTAEADNYEPLIVPDEGGMADVSAWLKKSGMRRVRGVHFGGAPRKPNLFANLAAEMWLGDLSEYFVCLNCGRPFESHFDDAADALTVHCADYNPACEIPGDEAGEEADELLSQLIIREWKPTGKKDQRKLESKAEMFERTGLHSPDHADGFCLSVVRSKIARLV